MKKNDTSGKYNYKDYLIRKVVLYFLIFSLVLSLLLMISLRAYQTSLTKDLGSQIAYAFSEKVDIWLNGLVLEIEGISKASDGILNVNEKMGDNFKEICNEKPGYFETLFITNIEGMAHDCHDLNNKIDDRDYFKAIVNGERDTIISEPLVSRASGEMVVVIAIRLTDENGHTEGLFGGTVNLSEFKQVLSDVKIEGNGEAVVISENGDLICTSDLSGDYVSNLNFINSFDRRTKEKILTIENGSLYSNNPYKQNRNDFIFVNTLEYSPGWQLLVLVPDAEIINKFWVMMLLISALLITGTIILTFIIRHSANRIVKPLEETIKAIDQFDIDEFSLNIPETEIRELALLKASFENMAFNLFKTIEEKEKFSEELTAANEELSANHQALENSCQQLEKLSTELENIFETAAEMNHVNLKSEEDYLHHLLEMLINIIDKAEYGSVSLYQDESWNFVCAIGHDIEKLKSLKLKRHEQIEVPKTIVIKNVLDEGTSSFDNESREKLVEASKPIGHTIIGKLRIGNEVVGTISIDSTEGAEAFNEEDVRVFDAFSNFAASFLGTKRLLNAKNMYQEKLVLSIIKILEIHDPYTKGHSENVGIMAEKVASQYGLSTEECHEVYWAGLVHDIGKILIPSSVLLKTGRLTIEEYEQIQQHPVWGAEILSTAKELDSMVQAVKYHHERWDGNGYPFGVKGKEIPLYSRIISVADTFDAMTSDRSYRIAMSFEDAVEEIKRNSGTQFDPEIVKTFIEMLENRKILV